MPYPLFLLSGKVSFALSETNLQLQQVSLRRQHDAETASAAVVQLGDAFLNQEHIRSAQMSALEQQCQSEVLAMKRETGLVLDKLAVSEAAAAKVAGLPLELETIRRERDLALVKVQQQEYQLLANAAP